MPTPYGKKSKAQKTKAHATKKAWSMRNREKVARYKHKHYLENREKYLSIERERSYRKLYGIGISDYDVMLIAQNGACAICRTTNAGKSATFERFFAVDHCHETGRVRGLLCVACNTRLGYLTWFEKNKDAVARYLSPKPYLKVVA